MFYFEQLLTQGLAGIDRTAIIPTVIGIAYAILLVGFLVGLYHAALRGGDLQSLAITAIKYLAIAIILANWSSAFRGVNSSFNQVAHYIDNASGIGDMFLNWWDQLRQQFSTTVQRHPSRNRGRMGRYQCRPGSHGRVPRVCGDGCGLCFFLCFVRLRVVCPWSSCPRPAADAGSRTDLPKSYATNLMIWNLGAFSTLHSAHSSLPSSLAGSTMS